MKRILLVVLLLLVIPAQAQFRPSVSGQTLRDVLTGVVAPLNLELKDLDDGWFKIALEEDETRWTVGSFIWHQGTNSNGVFYTKGNLLNLGGETFMVAYQRREDEFDALETILGNKKLAFLSTTPETPLELAMIRIGSIKILKGMRRFDLQQEIALSTRLNELLSAQNPFFKEKSTSQDNLRQLGLALLSYRQDHQDQLPPLTNVTEARAALQPYIKDETIFIQPLGEPYLPNPKLSQKRLNQILDPQAMIVYYEPTALADGTRTVLFVDGHVKQITKDEWLQLKQTSMIP